MNTSSFSPANGTGGTAAATGITTAPGALPLLGHGLRFVRDPLEFITSLRAHGDVVAIRIGTTKAFVANHPDLIRMILVDKADAFDKGPQHEKLRPVFGNGLTVTDDASHLQQRRLMQPAFHHQQVAGYVQVMQETAEAAIGAWAPGAPIRPDKEIYALLVAMVSKNLFSTSVDEETVAKIQAALPVMLNGIGWRSLDPTDLLEKLPIPANRRFNRVVSRMHAMVDDVIDRHESTAGDLLSLLKEARDPDTGQPMSPQQIHDEIITLMMVGSETSSNTLSWACHLLSRHPDIQSAVQAETDRVLEGRPAQAEDLGELAYTRRVVTETLRLYPPTWILARRATTDVDLGPYRIPAGATVCYSPYAVHRDPSFYSEPDRFDPDRWLPERADGLCRAAYLPFGTGNRGCIGEPVAWAQTAVVLSTIARHWTLGPAPGVEVRPSAKLLLMPDGLSLVPRPRHDAPRTPASSPG
ncbi:cytochrome P450 [Streptomyces sp. NPDC087263]|uniref:cytochrome P450 n=1 Tax=Streptomyces sp. NPDC087263 TaxID=3365773 RepID=UPI003823AC7B